MYNNVLFYDANLVKTHVKKKKCSNAYSYNLS